jgi:hypothetical protein
LEDVVFVGGHVELNELNLARFDARPERRLAVLGPL